jgi:hypothetical protein
LCQVYAAGANEGLVLVEIPQQSPNGPLVAK